MRKKHFITGQVVNFSKKINSCHRTEGDTGTAELVKNFLKVAF